MREIEMSHYEQSLQDKLDELSVNLFRRNFLCFIP